ncbi:hypothetical protein GBAR_LOCUS776 [Geodia barretti]|uniref:Uncharacterized protein n=1 Tax=Geodia barretti TaxID=519541 RepID=A0AA35VTH2_GEOBA|nr:hypothetical protein GBAR_LOCUS776 [Geodia barretti]
MGSQLIHYKNNIKHRDMYSFCQTLIHFLSICMGSQAVL